MRQMMNMIYVLDSFYSILSTQKERPQPSTRLSKYFSNRRAFSKAANLSGESGGTSHSVHNNVKSFVPVDGNAKGLL